MSNTKLVVSVGSMLSGYALFALVLFPWFIGCVVEPTAQSQEPVQEVKQLPRKKLKVIYAATETKDMDNGLWHVWTINEEKYLQKWRYRVPTVVIDVGLEDYNYVEMNDTTDPLQWNPTIHLKSFEDIFLFDGAKQ